MSLAKIFDLLRCSRNNISCNADILTIDDARNKYKDYQYAIPESTRTQCRRYCWKEYMESFARTVDVVFIIFTSWRVKSPGSIPCTIK